LRGFSSGGRRSSSGGSSGGYGGYNVDKDPLGDDSPTANTDNTNLLKEYANRMKQVANNITKTKSKKSSPLKIGALPALVKSIVNSKSSKSNKSSKKNKTNLKINVTK
jgi:hypothetical protein